MTQMTATRPARTRTTRTVKMTSVVKVMRTTYIGGPDSGRTRAECWEAKSRDGEWGYVRAEDNGTLWFVTHIHTGASTDMGYRSLSSARTATANGSAIRQLIAEATEIVDNPLWPDSVREEAAGYLTFLLAYRDSD